MQAIPPPNVLGLRTVWNLVALDFRPVGLVPVLEPRNKDFLSFIIFWKPNARTQPFDLLQHPSFLRDLLNVICVHCPELFVPFSDFGIYLAEFEAPIRQLRFLPRTAKTIE
jgi:hypothetical protein